MKQWHSATASRMKLRSVFLIEFLGDNPEPVRSWKIARQTERRRMYPWRAAPYRAFDRSCRTAPTTAGRDVSGGR